MLYKEAEEFGKECGLGFPEEFVNNVIIHCTTLFTYDNINKELNELKEDAKKNGVVFSEVCGYAVDKGNALLLCSMCTKLAELDTNRRKNVDTNKI